LNRAPEEILRAAGVAFAVHEHVPVTTVAEIIQALPYPAEEHVKTLAFDADGRIALAGLRGSDRIAYGKLALALHVPRDKVSPLPPERVREELGLEPGGVCLFVDRDDVTRIIDGRVAKLDRVFTGAGRNDATLELSAADLIAAAAAEVADFAADA
jgi:prolyl-tRNA editing enzyme YbaK/EbsC (Cys-tRNA(Pro) deacylase)